jgi:hypothetical protein
MDPTLLTTTIIVKWATHNGFRPSWQNDLKLHHLTCILGNSKKEAEVILSVSFVI